MRRIVAAVALIMLGGCQQQNEAAVEMPINPSPVVASVNGTPIHAADLDLKLTMLPERMASLRSDERTRIYLLKTLIRQHAISQKAKALGLDLDPETRRRIEEASRQILVEAATQWQQSRMQKVSMDDVQAYYKQHLSDFVVPEQVHARHILVATRSQAESVIKRLRRGADFATLAVAESLDDSNKSRGGDLNWFQRGVMVDAFDAVVFALEEGQISKPVKTRFGWHVIELLGRRAAMQKPLEEVSEEITGILEQARLEAWYQAVEKEADIRIIDPGLR